MAYLYHYAFHMGFHNGLGACVSNSIGPIRAKSASSSSFNPCVLIRSLEQLILGSYFTFLSYGYPVVYYLCAIKQETRTTEQVHGVGTAG